MRLLPSNYWGRITLAWSVGQFVAVGLLEIVLAAQHATYVSNISDLRQWPNPASWNNTVSQKDFIVGNAHAITVYHALVCFAMLFQLVMAYDAIMNMSVIQLVATTLFNFCVAIYTIVQNRQAANLLNDVAERFTPNLTRHPTGVVEIVIIIAMFVFFVGWAFLTYRLYNVFGWTVFKELGADVNVRKQLMVHHVHLLLLKLDVFFFLGFSFQFVFLVLASSNNTQDTIIHASVATPVAIFLLILAYVAIRKENTILMIATILGLLAGAVYMVIKIIEVNGTSVETVTKFHSSKNSLTFFIALTLLMTLITCVSAVLNLMQFGKGLRDHLERRNRPAHSVELYSLNK
ncbi:hypothetical protein HK105_207997 [Polyrhizophydium stewartii]|uniref:Uncharacterized protein n=1 Tax=Polyrhizophydium stewartii TaxID=2732419 RepID=A0ABR4MYZ7_9FUNG